MAGFCPPPKKVNRNAGVATQWALAASRGSWALVPNHLCAGRAQGLDSPRPGAVRDVGSKRSGWGVKSCFFVALGATAGSGDMTDDETHLASKCSHPDGCPAHGRTGPSFGHPSFTADGCGCQGGVAMNKQDGWASWLRTRFLYT